MRRAAIAVCTAVLGALVIVAPSSSATPVGLRIWPLGDSITMGALGPSRGVPGGYRGFLDAELQSAGVAHTFVGSLESNATALLQARGQAAHDGHPAFYLDEVAAGVAGPISAHAYTGGYWVRGVDPDVIVLHVGTNDVIHRIDPGLRYATRDGKADVSDPGQRHRFVADLTRRLQRLLDELQRLRPRAVVVLATITPVGADACDPVTPDFAAAVRALGAREHAAGARVEVADVWSAYTHEDGGVCRIDPGLLSADHVHPTSAGYSVMSGVFARALIALRG